MPNAVTITVRKRCAGSYDIDTPAGTYQLSNCPVDTSDEFTKGLPRGPRWMLTSPGEYHADSEFPTKREAVTYVRTIQQEQADQAAKEATAVTETTTPQQAYGVFADSDLVEDAFRGDYGRIAAGATAANYTNDPANEGITFTVKSICPTHHKIDLRGEFANQLAVPACQDGTTYGAWSEASGGFIIAGDCALDVANDAAEELLTLAADDDTDTIQILAVCRIHEDQPADTCEYCNAEDDEDEN